MFRRTSWAGAEKEAALRRQIRRIERDVPHGDPEGAYWKIAKLVGAHESAEGGSEFDANLRASTISGGISVGAAGGAWLASQFGHEMVSSGLTKLAISAAIPFLVFSTRVAKTGNDLRKRRCIETYPRAREIVKNMPRPAVEKLARDAAIARRLLDPEKNGVATAILHAAVEVLSNGNR